MSAPNGGSIDGWECLAVESREDQNGERKSYFTRIGRVKQNRDGSYNVYCAAYPANGATFQIRPPYNKEERQQQGSGQGQKRNPPQNRQSSRDDDIPF